MRQRIQSLFRLHDQQAEKGQTLVMFLVLSVLMFAAAMGSIDMGTYVHERQKLEITVDAAVLAGGLELPSSGFNATNMALQYIALNDPDVSFGNVTPSFRCLVGDRNHDGNPDEIDIPAVCDPGPTETFTCNDGLCVANCVFDGSNTCNVMALVASKDVPLFFTTLLGLPPATITVSRTGSCKGLCGDPPNVPLDMVMIIDRTGSMSAEDLDNAKDGALAVLEIFNPELQHVGLGVLGAGNEDNPCADEEPDHGGIWQVVPLSSDYQNEDGTLNEDSQLVTIIECLFTSSQGTNLGSPINDDEFGQPDALTALIDSGREGVKKGIILLSDGAANEPQVPGPDQPCNYAFEMAEEAKDEGIVMFTIGYGIEGERCTDDDFGPYDNVRVTELLADMASDSADDHGHCSNENNSDAENQDGDNFLCQPRGGDLEEVFTAAAAALASGIHLIAYPE